MVDHETLSWHHHNRHHGDFSKHVMIPFLCKRGERLVGQGLEGTRSLALGGASDLIVEINRTLMLWRRREDSKGR